MSDTASKDWQEFPHTDESLSRVVETFQGQPDLSAKAHIS